MARKLISHFLPIPERAIRGFMWRTIREWQLTYKMDLGELSNLGSDDRVNAVLKIMEIFGVQIKRVLINKEQEPVLEDAMQQALNMYNEKFANR